VCSEATERAVLRGGGVTLVLCVTIPTDGQPSVASQLTYLISALPPPLILATFACASLAYPAASRTFRRDETVRWVGDIIRRELMRSYASHAPLQDASCVLLYNLTLHVRGRSSCQRLRAGGVLVVLEALRLHHRDNMPLLARAAQLQAQLLV
jgi:hypothetical protein